MGKQGKSRSPMNRLLARWRAPLSCVCALALLWLVQPGLAFPAFGKGAKAGQKTSAGLVRYQRFIKRIEKKLARSPKSARLHTILGRLYQRANLLPKAARHYKLALRYQRNYSHAMVGMAHVSLRNGKPKQARRWLKRVFRKHPRHASAWAEQSELWRTLALRSKRKIRKKALFQKAINAMQKAVVNRPKSHRFRYRLGILYLAQRQAFHANIQFAAAHAKMPIHPCYKLGLSVSESLLMRKRKTLYSDLKEGVQRCGHPLLSRMGGSMLVVVGMQRAQKLSETKQLGKAIKLMTEATGLAPHENKGFFYLALLQYQNKQCFQARKTLYKILRRDPKHSLANKLLRHSKALRCGPLPSRRFFRKTYGDPKRRQTQQQRGHKRHQSGKIKGKMPARR